MEDRSSIEKSFQKMKVSWKTEKDYCSGAQEILAYSRREVIKAKMVLRKVKKHRKVQRLMDA